MPHPEPAALASDLTRWIDRWRPDGVTSIYWHDATGWQVHMPQPALSRSSAGWLAGAIPCGTDFATAGDRRDMRLDGVRVLWFVGSATADAFTLTDAATLLAELGAS